MEKEEPKKETYALEEISKYRAMALAPEHFREYSETGKSGNLEQTLVTFYEKGLEVKNRRDIEDAVQALMVSPQGLQTFIKNFKGRYDQALHSQKIRDLRKLYDPIFRGTFSPEALLEVDRVFNSDETYESVSNKYHDALIDTQKKNINKVDKEKAEKIVEALGKIVIPLSDSEDEELDKLRSPIKTADRVKRWNALYEPKKEEKKE